MSRSNLCFLGKYRKDELVRYLASLHLYAQNSSNILRLSMMVYEALCGKGGRKHLHIPTFQKEIEKNYSHDMYEDPQEYMFVDLSFNIILPACLSWLRLSMSKQKHFHLFMPYWNCLIL